MADIKVQRYERLVITLNDEVVLDEDISESAGVTPAAFYKAILKSYDMGAQRQRLGLEHGTHRIEGEEHLDEEDFHTNT